MERCRPAYRPKDDQTSEARGCTHTPVDDEREGTHAPPEGGGGACVPQRGAYMHERGCVYAPKEGFEKRQEETLSLTPAEQAVADATDATPEETREMIILITRESNVRNTDSYIPKMKPLDLVGVLARVRVRVRRTPTPAPPPYDEVRARQAAQAVPRPRADEPPPDPQGQAVAEPRARLLKGSPRAPLRATITAPARAALPAEPDPAAEAARAELLQSGDFDQWMTAAYDKLGEDVHRDEVVILAAALRRTAIIASGSPL